MKIPLLLLPMLLALPQGNELRQLQVGESAPMTDYVMATTGGERVSLQTLKGENGLCVIFSCNTCPYVIGWEDRYNELAGHCELNGIGFILVNSNEAKRDNDDSMEAMKAHAQEKSYGGYAYALDKGHKLADAFGATKTPDVFLFDKNLKLTYKGAIDDNMKSREAVRSPYLRQAIANTAAGKPCDPAETKALGCTIKRIG